MKNLVVLFLIICFPVSVSAQAIRLLCDYKFIASEDGYEPVSSTFALEFNIDPTTGEAFMVGNNGLSKVELFMGEYGFTLFELLATGVSQTTTIEKSPAFRTVHSRHTLIKDPATNLNEFVASQYYGQCYSLSNE